MSASTSLYKEATFPRAREHRSGVKCCSYSPAMTHVARVALGSTLAPPHLGVLICRVALVTEPDSHGREDRPHAKPRP